MASNISNCPLTEFYLEQIVLNPGTNSAGYKLRPVVPSRNPGPFEFNLTTYEAAWKAGNIIWVKNHPLKGLYACIHPSRVTIIPISSQFFAARNLSDPQKFIPIEIKGICGVTDYDTDSEPALLRAAFRARFDALPVFTPKPPVKRPVSAAPAPVLPTPSAPSLSIIQSNPSPTPSAPTLSNSQFVQSVPKYIPTPPSKRPEGQKA